MIYRNPICLSTSMIYSKLIDSMTKKIFCTTKLAHFQNPQAILKMQEYIKFKVWRKDKLSDGRKIMSWLVC